MNFLVSLEARKVLANSFSRRTLLHGESWLERKLQHSETTDERKRAEIKPLNCILESPKTENGVPDR
jgi:hypothetical protein